MPYDKLCDEIIKNVGGKENVEGLVHCITRLRFSLKNRNLVNKQAIRDLDKVVDIVDQPNQFQVVIGPEVPQVYKVLAGKLDLKQEEQKAKGKKEGNPINRLFTFFSEVIAPIIPIIMCVGMLAGILSIFTNFNLIDSENSTYLIFASLKDAMFYFLPVFLAISSSKQFGISPYLATLLAVTLLSTGINGVENLTLFGFALPAITYSNSFLPILLAIWFMAKVQRVVEKFIPKSLDFFFTPLIVLIITLPVTLFIFGRLGLWISDMMALVFEVIGNTVGSWFAVTVYSAIQPLLIMTGGVYFVMPLVLDSLATTGFEMIFMPGGLISDIAVCGAMMGYFLRAKDVKQKQFFGVMSFNAFMNITEPAVFGVFAKYRKAFIAAILGGAAGGLIVGLAGVKSYAFTTLLGITSFIEEENSGNFYFLLLGLIVSFFTAGVVAYVLGIPEETIDTEKTQESTNLSIDKVKLFPPVDGQVVPLSDVKDKAFSSGALGDGIGIKPISNTIKAPLAGEIVSLFPTNHALGIKNKAGVEVLIHIGIDTVELESGIFTSHVQLGDKVEVGQPLIDANFKEIEEAGLDTTVLMIVTNTDEFLNVLPKVNAKEDEELLTIIL
ncbi:MAG: beta-glucoside-specific PTS transporter subunit IIABC [Enterococcus sp.]